MKRTALTIAIAVTAMVASTGVALAVEAVVNRDSPIYRSRTSNEVVNYVDEGEIVEVVQCRSNRCELEDLDGRDGWIAQRRLSAIDEGGTPRPSIQFNFEVAPGLSIGIGGGGVSVGIGSSSGPSSGPRACFFRDTNYNGPSFCIADGESRSNFNAFGWNDRVSSVRLYGGTDARVCVDAGFGSPCRTYTSNQSSLGPFNDQISSARAF